MGLKSVLGGSKKEGAAKRSPVRNESTRTEPVDEHKQLARRRLVGSVALLLIAIVVLPLVLEDAPKPVSPDIALQIPSRDLPSALSDKPASTSESKADVAKADTAKADAAKADAAKADTSAPAAVKALDAKPAEPRQVDVKPTDAKPVDGKPADAKPAETKAAAPKLAESKTPEAKLTEPKSPESKVAEPKAGKQLPVVDDPIAGFANAKVNPATQASTPAAKSSTAVSPPAAASGSPRSNHWVQIGAFGNEAKAREMASQLRGKGYPAVTEVVRGGGSELYRVRVGPLETKESASRARDNLAKSGFEGAVVQ